MRFHVSGREIIWNDFDLDRKIELIREMKARADGYLKSKQLRLADEEYLKINKVLKSISKKLKKNLVTEQKLLLVNSMRNYGKLLYKQGRFEEAIQCLVDVHKNLAFVSKLFYEKMLYFSKINRDDPEIVLSERDKILNSLREKSAKQPKDDMDHSVIFEIEEIQKRFKSPGCKKTLDHDQILSKAFNLTGKKLQDFKWKQLALKEWNQR